PMLDVLLATALILSTGGHRSPFSLWLVFAIMGAGFSRYRWLPVVTALTALTVHCLIAAGPPNEALDYSGFFVRTSYYFGLASVLSAITFYLNAQAQALTVLESVSRPMAAAMTREEVIEILLERLATELSLEDVSYSSTDIADTGKSDVSASGRG